MGLLHRAEGMGGGPASSPWLSWAGGGLVQTGRVAMFLRRAFPAPGQAAAVGWDSQRVGTRPFLGQGRPLACLKMVQVWEGEVERRLRPGGASQGRKAERLAGRGDPNPKQGHPSQRVKIYALFTNKVYKPLSSQTLSFQEEDQRETACGPQCQRSLQSHRTP